MGRLLEGGANKVSLSVIGRPLYIVLLRNRKNWFFQRNGKSSVHTFFFTINSSYPYWIIVKTSIINFWSFFIGANALAKCRFYK